MELGRREIAAQLPAPYDQVHVYEYIRAVEWKHKKCGGIKVVFMKSNGNSHCKGSREKGQGEGGCLIFHHIYTTMSPSLSWWLSSKLCALLLLQHYGRIAAVAAASDATSTIAWIAAPPAAASTTISTPRCFERGSRKNGRPNGTHCESTITTADPPRKQATNQRERGKVARLAMNQRSNFEPDGLGQAEEMDVNIPDISDGGEGGEEEPRLVVPGLPSLAITREKLIIAGWSGLLGVAYAGGREDQKSYSARKRRLFESIGGDDIRYQQSLFWIPTLYHSVRKCKCPSHINNININILTVLTLRTCWYLVLYLF